MLDSDIHKHPSDRFSCTRFQGVVVVVVVVVVIMTHTGCVTRIPPVPSLAFCPTFSFFCDAQRKGDHIQPRGSRRVSLLCLLCSGPLGGEQLIPSIIIGLPAAHYSLSPLLLQRLLHTLWIVVDADQRKTRSRFSSFRGKEDKSLGKGEETVVATPGLEFHGISRHKFDEPQSNKSTLLF